MEATSQIERRSLLLLVFSALVSLPCAFLVAPSHHRARLVSTTMKPPFILNTSHGIRNKNRIRIQANTPFPSTFMSLDAENYLPQTAVLDAIQQRQGRPIMASDLAASAGISLRDARRDLTALATMGEMDVSTDGDLVYTFPNNFQSMIATRSLQYKLQQTLRQAWPAIFYGVRVAFGVVLLTSLLAIFTTIFLISQGSSNSDNDDRRRDRGSPMSFGGSWWGPSPFDFFYYRPYGYYYTQPGQPKRDPEEMGFLESVFSYIFGDGNPNADIDTKRLQLASNYIRDKNGAVTCEELAPFCDDLPPDPSNLSSESFVLPIVTALAGEPRVTNDGDIVYVFPELQLSATNNNPTTINVIDSSAIMLKKVGLEPDSSPRQIKDLLDRSGISTRGALERKDLLSILALAMPPMTKQDETLFGEQDLLLEEEYTFSLTSDANKVLAGGLGVVNLVGALYLGQLFNSYAMYGVKLPSYFGLVQAGYPLLLSYAVLFNIIPLVRSFWVKKENEQIQRRNEKRRLWKTAAAGITRKLSAARQLGTKMKQWKASDTIYSTGKALTEQDRTKQQAILDDFDRMLENS